MNLPPLISFWYNVEDVFDVETTVLTTGLVLDVDEVFVVVELTTVLDTGFVLDDEDVVFVVVTTVGFALDDEDDVFVVVTTVFAPGWMMN